MGGRQEKQGMVELDISYRGLHKFFCDIFKKGVIEVEIAVRELTIEEVQLISMVGSEYMYLTVDMKTENNITEILMLNEIG